MIDPTIVGAGVWLWEKLGKDILTKSAGAAAGGWKRLNWSRLASDYLESIKKHYSTATLIGNTRQIDLASTFTDVYAYDEPSAKRRLNLDKNGIVQSGTDLESLLNAKRMPLLNVVKENKRLYVLGKPGSGKTTFLKKVLLEACESRIAKTPIFVGLRDWADSKSNLLEHICREFEMCAFPDPAKFVITLLSAGDAIVLFDGLDEVNGEGGRRAEIIRNLTEFARAYSNVSIIVTCRVAATDYSFDRFKYVEIADFNHDQQLDFVAKWYAQRSSAHDTFLEGWNSPEGDRFRDLAKTPLLLALLCLAFDETLKFPTRRVELYQEAFNALLRKWDSSRGISRDVVYKNLSHIRREQLLSRLAANMFFASEFLVTKPHLAAKLSAHISEFPKEANEAPWEVDKVLQAIEEQHGILVERAHQWYAFSHLTFQEYLTAKFIVENSYDESVVAKLEASASNDQWREVYSLTASLLGNAQILFTALQRAMKNCLRSAPGLSHTLREATEHASHQQAHESEGATQLFDNSARVVRARTLRAARHESALELSLQIAASRHFERGGSAAIHRARSLAAALNDPDSRICVWLESNGNSSVRSSALVNYLRINAVYCECLDLSTVSNRANLSSVILAPFS